MRYLGKISYDGSEFEGFQRLNNGKGVQNELENVLSKIAKQQVDVKGSGRTDRGVHALNQGISFTLSLDITPDKLKYVMNRLLNPYVTVKELKVVEDDFHARFNAKEKTYLYKVYYGEKDSFLNDYVAYIYQKPNMRLMSSAAKVFVGTHTFTNFVSGYRDNYETTIYKINVKKAGNYYYFTFTGTGFYRYMIRHLVGAILDVGMGKCALNDIKKALDNPNQKRTFSVMIPNGLYLVDVKY